MAADHRDSRHGDPLQLLSANLRSMWCQRFLAERRDGFASHSYHAPPGLRDNAAGLILLRFHVLRSCIALAGSCDLSLPCCKGYRFYLPPFTEFVAGCKRSPSNLVK